MALRLNQRAGFVPDVAGVPLVSSGGYATSSVPTGAANTVVSAAAGRLCRIIVSTTGTAAAAPGCPLYDNATTNSGTVLFVVPGNAAAGTSYDPGARDRPRTGSRPRTCSMVPHSQYPIIEG